MSISQKIRPSVFGKVDCLDIEVITSPISDLEHLNRLCWRGKWEEILPARKIDIEVTPLVRIMLLAAMILLQNLIDRGHLLLIQVACYSSMTMTIPMEHEHLHVAFLL